ncbi:methyltransferase domain-containing protein [Actinocrinis puniceicyclus]|uniref:Methyltransferase domain-containing protein n=1 Tax=Actinocrinis puniceicyclus TaxID=977794 RepID=A0A8J7WKM8_9ACTN|nr:methyltransferase domain-containing protein [Actinocrinis puniceicyclus]MBS2964046.1 methyltransferase domain-containing protein [Actinocrinis puniceicyclus]
MRTAVLWGVVRSALETIKREPAAGDVRSGRAAAGEPGPPVPLDIVDVGGGTGGFAVALAGLGHRITVIDPSPDALAALERRATEAGASDSVRAVQGDLGTVFDVLEPGSCDAVLCHGVLEYVEDPAEGCRSARGLLRPGGIASFLAANRTAVVLARALGGHVAEALAALHDPRGRFGAHDPVPRRFGEQALRDLVEQAGLTVHAVHGVRIFADLVPAAAIDVPVGSGPAANVADLLSLEAAASALPEFRAMATQLHVLAGLDEA